VSHPKDNKILDVLVAVVDSLRGTRAPYMIIGAWALAVWGRPRATMDLEDALSVLARSRELLDFRYLDQWARRLDLTAELNYLLRE
jgi:hypothetical protein